MRDLHDAVEARVGFIPTTITNANTATPTAIIDKANFASVEFVIVLGPMTDANATFQVSMEHGDASNLSDTAVPGAADLLGSVGSPSWTFASDSNTWKIGYIGAKRYVRLTVTPSGNDAGSASYACVALLGNARKQPRSTQLV